MNLKAGTIVKVYGCIVDGGSHSPILHGEAARVVKDAGFDMYGRPENVLLQLFDTYEWTPGNQRKLRITKGWAHIRQVEQV